MGDSRPVNLFLSLPSELADEVERVQESDPGFLEQVVAYGLVRRAVFEHLRGRMVRDPATTPTVEAS